MLASAREVLKKELLEVLRDRRSLFVLVLLPVALYPLLFIGSALVATAQARKLRAREYVVWVDAPEQAPPGLIEQLRLRRAGGAAPLVVEPLPAGTDLPQALSEGRVQAALLGAAGADQALASGARPALEIHYDAGIDASVLARDRVGAAIDRWSQALVEARLERAGLTAEALDPVALDLKNRGASGAQLARILSTLLVMLALTGAFYPALDMGAGEKERGTLETLLLAPVPRVSIALGKFGAVFCVSLCCAVLHLLSLGLTFGSFAALIPAGAGALPDALALRPDPLLLPAMLLVLIPLVALFAALSLAASTFAASYKEGQAYLTPLVLAGTLPAMAAAVPGVELTAAMCLVPVANAALLMKALLAGTARTGQVVLTCAASFAYAALALRWVASLYDREEVLWRPAAAQGPDLLGLRARRSAPAVAGRRPTLPQALALGVFAVLLLWFAGVPLQERSAPLGLAVTLVALVALPAVLYARLLGCDLRATFRLRRPPAGTLLAAALMALGLVVVGLHLAQLQTRWTGPLSPEEVARAEEVTLGLLAEGPLLVLLLLAVLPGVCEEVAFRGFVLSGLRRDGGRAGAVLVSALLFGLVHLDPGRLLHTTFLGVVLAGLTLRAGSIAPAMLLHGLYNATTAAVTAPASDGLTTLQRLGLLDAAGQPTWTLRALGLGLLLAGVLLLVAVTPRRRERG